MGSFRHWAAAAALYGWFLLFILGSQTATAHSSLRADFYRHSCPNAEEIVRSVVEKAVRKEARMAGSLLRLHFHDCFVQGCDASLLLASTGSFVGEQDASRNKFSVRGFDVIQDIKTALESACPSTVSCADILAIAARDSVVVSGGPSYRVRLGRRDSVTASSALPDQFLPGFNFNVSQLVESFEAVGLSAHDMVTLSGGHTLAKANCLTFNDRFNPPDLTMDTSYRASLEKLCQANNTSTFANLDVGTPNVFDNQYYKNLLKGKGLLHSDQVLYTTDGSTRNLVLQYSKHQSSFFHDFKAAMLKMGNISPLTGKQGEIRKQCSVVNS